MVREEPLPNAALNFLLQIGHCWVKKPRSPFNGALTGFKGAAWTRFKASGLFFMVKAPFVHKPHPAKRAGGCRH
jgi:hypothetical protein